jgi:cyclopropane-fatty-acyl-phospholipid synthase
MRRPSARATSSPRGPVRKAIGRIAGRLDQINWKSRSRQECRAYLQPHPAPLRAVPRRGPAIYLAYYRDLSNSLEQAQLDKKAHIAAKLYLKPGMKVLDIGCGWGGFALYLHRITDVDVLGVALAPDQIEFSNERAAEEGVADKVKFELMDYRDVKGQFDRISNVGLIEHLGTPHYPGFYEHMTHRLLKDDGVMFSHCCGRMGEPGVTDKWTRKYIFPGGYIPALSELVTQAEKHRLIVSDVEAMRYHYAYTLEEWYNRTVAHNDEIVELYDERFYRMWLFYLAGAEAAFRYGGMVNWQLQYVKRRDAIPMTRDYMYEESARLRGLEEAPQWHAAAQSTPHAAAMREPRAPALAAAQGGAGVELGAADRAVMVGIEPVEQLPPPLGAAAGHVRPAGLEPGANLLAGDEAVMVGVGTGEAGLDRRLDLGAGPRRDGPIAAFVARLGERRKGDEGGHRRRACENKLLHFRNLPCTTEEDC